MRPEKLARGKALIVVHKELINEKRFNVMIFSDLSVNNPVMWISVQFCGILFCLFFGHF